MNEVLGNDTVEVVVEVVVGVVFGLITTLLIIINNRNIVDHTPVLQVEIIFDLHRTISRLARFAVT